jgi:hypothetical protein
MTPSRLLALLEILPDFSRLENLLPILAGAVAGMGVVGMIHFIIRPRVAKAAAAAKEATVASDPFIGRSSSDNRLAARRQGKAIDVIISNRDTKEPPTKGFVLDRSLGGLRLLSDSGFDVDAQLSVRPLNVSPFAPWVDLVVKSCKQTDIGFEIGCQFLNQPTYASMLMFG